MPVVPEIPRKHSIRKQRSKQIPKTAKSNLLRRALLFLLVFMFVATVLPIGLFSKTAGAVTSLTGNNIDPDKKVQSYLYFNAMVECLHKEAYVKDDFSFISEESALAYKWWNDQKVTIGQYVNDSSVSKEQDGITNCSFKAFIQKALNLWGMVGDETATKRLLCEIGYVRGTVRSGDVADYNPKQTVDYCAQADYLSFIVPDTLSTDRMVVNFDSYIQRSVYGGVDIALSQDNGEEYYLALGTLNNSCIPGIKDTPPTTGTSPNGPYDYVNANWVDMSNLNISPPPNYYVGKLKKDQKINYWSRGVDGGEELKCEEIFTRMNSNAPNFLRWKKDYKDVIVGEEEYTKTANDIEESCDSKVALFGWIICGILEGADSIVGDVTGVMKRMLTIDTSEYSQNEAEGYKTTWASLRILSSIIVVAIALFMILSQILGSEMFSAYTIKKLMPRLVIAIILIQLSWFLATTFIGVINVIGNGIEELIYAPFGGEAEVGTIGSNVGILLADSSVVAKEAIIGGAGLVAAAIAFGAAGGVFGIFALGLGVIIAMVMAIVFLTIRKVALVFLLILAPMAIALWILPNTQKTYKQWWQNFSKLLLMYPIIVGFLAIGKVFAHVAATAGAANDTNKLLTFFIVLIAYFGPFFLIPKTFKFAGGMMAMVGNGLNKAGGTMSKKGGEWIKSAGGDWAASKYKQGSRWRNLGSRTMTGNANVTKRGQAKIAERGRKYGETRSAEDEALLRSRLSGLAFKDPGAKTDQVREMVNLAKSDNKRLSTAAIKGLGNSNQWGEFDKNPELKQKVRNVAAKSPDFAAKVFDKRRDLSFSQEALDGGVLEKEKGISASEMAQFNSSFWTADEGKYAQQVAQSPSRSALEQLATNPQYSSYWGGMTPEAQDIILKALEGTPPESPTSPPTSPPTPPQAPPPTPPQAPLPPGADGNYPGSNDGPGGLWIPH